MMFRWCQYYPAIILDIYLPMQDIGSVSASPQRFLSPALPLQRMKAREVEGRKQTSATAWVRTSVISSTHATDPGQAGIGIAPQMTDMHVCPLTFCCNHWRAACFHPPLVAKHTFSPEAAIGAPSSTVLRPSHLPVIRSGLTFAITRRGHNGVLCGRLVAPPRVRLRCILGTLVKPCHLQPEGYTP